MSRCIVRFADGELRHVFFQNVSDCVLSRLYNSSSEMSTARWSTALRDSFDAECACDGEQVEVYCPYGGGSWWKAKACREHNVYKGPFVYYDDCADMDGRSQPPLIEEFSGEPEWLVEAQEKLAGGPRSVVP